MCTTASPSEAALIYAVFLGPLSLLPVVIGLVAWRTKRRGWLLAAAAGAALPLLFLLRNGGAGLADPASLAVVLLFVLGLGAWLTATRLPRAALPALLLVGAGALLLVTVFLTATAAGPSCEELMAPPTPRPFQSRF